MVVACRNTPPTEKQNNNNKNECVLNSSVLSLLLFFLSSSAARVLVQPILSLDPYALLLTLVLFFFSHRYYYLFIYLFIIIIISLSNLIFDRARTMNDDVPFGTPRKDFASPAKDFGSLNKNFNSSPNKGSDYSGEAADGKKLTTSSSTNSNQRILSAEEEQQHKDGCISSLRDVKVYFFTLMLCGAALFLIVPVVCLLSLYPLHNQMNTLLPNKVEWYMNYFSLVMAVDEADILMNYYTYFGEDELRVKMLRKASDATNTTISFLNQFCASMPTCHEADPTTLNTAFSTFTSTSFPAFVAGVTAKLSTLKSYTEQSSLRDTLFNAFVTEERQAQVSRGTYMLANAKLACYSIEDCWKSSDVQTFFNNAEKCVGNLVGSATAAMIDMFSVIEDPRLGETTASGVIAKNTERNTKRTDLITGLSATYTEAETLITPLNDPSTVPANLEVLYFVLPPDWAVSILDAINATMTFATEMNTEFLAQFGITSTATTGVEDALALNVSQVEVMSLAQALNSYFGYDIGSGLQMTVTDNELKEIQTYYSNNAGSYIRQLRTQVEALYTPTYDAVGSLVYSEDKSTEQAHILKLSVPVAIVCSLASFGLYLWALIIVRFHLPESPLSFRALLISSGRNTVRSPSIYIQILQNLNEDCDGVVNTVSRITRKVISNALLIAPNYTNAEEEFNSFSDVLVPLSASYASKPWYSNFFVMAQIIQNLLAAGFYPLRQAFTTASSLGFTAEALIKEFGITGVESGTATTPPLPCNLLTGASAMAQLNSNYFGLSAVRERLALGKVELNKDSLAGEFSSATLQTACLISYVLYANNQADCLNTVTCTAPATYGMLRSTSETDSMYSVFDPFSSSAMGSLLTNVQNLRLGLYHDLDSIFENVRKTAASDARTVELSRRFVMWAGIFTFLVLLFAVLVIRGLLFGNSIFSVFA
eukprot:gene2515-1570_t